MFFFLIVNHYTKISVCASTDLLDSYAKSHEAEFDKNDETDQNSIEHDNNSMTAETNRLKDASESSLDTTKSIMTMTNSDSGLGKGSKVSIRSSPMFSEVRMGSTLTQAGESA